MNNLTIRNVPDEVHLAIKAQARLHGRSTEAEVREILRRAATPPEAGLRMGDELAALGALFGGIELELPPRDTPMRIADFS